MENAAFRSDAMEGKEEDDTEEEDMDTESCDSNAASKDSIANERYSVLALTIGPAWIGAVLGVLVFLLITF
jgi:hypothetical protein